MIGRQKLGYNKAIYTLTNGRKLHKRTVFYEEERAYRQTAKKNTSRQCERQNEQQRTSPKEQRSGRARKKKLARRHQEKKNSQLKTQGIDHTRLKETDKKKTD